MEFLASCMSQLNFENLAPLGPPISNTLRQCLWVQYRFSGGLNVATQELSSYRNGESTSWCLYCMESPWAVQPSGRPGTMGVTKCRPLAARGPWSEPGPPRRPLAAHSPPRALLMGRHGPRVGRCQSATKGTVQERPMQNFRKSNRGAHPRR